MRWDTRSIVIYFEKETSQDVREIICYSNSFKVEVPSTHDTFGVLYDIWLKSSLKFIKLSIRSINSVLYYVTVQRSKSINRHCSDYCSTKSVRFLLHLFLPCFLPVLKFYSLYIWILTWLYECKFMYYISFFSIDRFVPLSFGTTVSTYYRKLVIYFTMSTFTESIKVDLNCL